MFAGDVLAPEVLLGCEGVVGGAAQCKVVELVRGLRYLKEAGLGCGDFTKWPEWEAIDAYRRAQFVPCALAGDESDADNDCAWSALLAD